MKDAAEANQLITLRCYKCRRSVTYLAKDLVGIVGEEWSLHIPPFNCHKDGPEFTKIEVWTATAEDRGRVPVRRPTELVQKWKTVMLGH